MFEYILAGFTGTFFSYCCVFCMGVEVHAGAAGTASDKVLKIMNIHNENVEQLMNKMKLQNTINERKLDLILQQLPRGISDIADNYRNTIRSSY